MLNNDTREERLTAKYSLQGKLTKYPSGDRVTEVKFKDMFFFLSELNATHSSSVLISNLLDKLPKEKSYKQYATSYLDGTEEDNIFTRLCIAGLIPEGYYRLIQ